jgi:O-methyltransferase
MAPGKLIELLAECNAMLGFDRAINIAHMVLQTEAQPGALVELGIGRGATARLMTALTTKLVYVYDSFEGLPDVPPEDQIDPTWKRGTFACSVDEVIAGFRRHGLRLPVVCKGWFADIPDDSLPNAISFAHIDGDLYQSTLDALGKVYDRLTRGAVVILDDYGWEMTPGVVRACDEFFADKEEQVMPLLVRSTEYPHACFVKA